MEEPSLEIGAYRLLKTLGIGAFGKVKREWYGVPSFPSVCHDCLTEYCCTNSIIRSTDTGTSSIHAVSALSKREERGKQCNVGTTRPLTKHIGCFVLV